MGPGGESVRRAERFLLLSLIAMQLGLRILLAFHHEVDSDEPQHLHVAWSIGEGRLQYRDVFDNHAPLFQTLTAPIARIIGERPDILIFMRLLMIPLWIAALVASGWIAGSLFGRRAALWTVAVAGFWPDALVTSVEYRTDILWAALGLFAAAVLVAGRWSRGRAAIAGTLIGLAFCVSLKSSLYVLAALVTALILWVLLRGRRIEPGPRRIALDSLAAIPGLILPFALTGLWFTAHGAGRSFLYCTILHNVVPGLGAWHKAPWRPVIFPLALPALLFAGKWLIDSAETQAIGVRRAFVALSAGAYLALLDAFWPLITRQDYLPVEPLAIAAVVPLLLRFTDRFVSVRGPGFWSIARALPLLVILVEVVPTVVREAPWRDAARSQTLLLGDVLQLTHPDQFIMDEKGETVFRPRASYYVLEGVTKTRIAMGLLPDDIAARLIDTRTCVVAPDSPYFPDSSRRYMNAHYLSVGRLRVLGRWLAFDADGTSAEFVCDFPETFALLGPHGPAAGRLDGRLYRGPLRLESGRHVYRRQPDEGEVALVWARAVALGFQPAPSKGRGP